MPPRLRGTCDECLSSRDCAEAFRKALWYTTAWATTDLDPSNDGRNGFEFSVMCAKLNVPMVRYREEGGKLHLMDPRVIDRNGVTAGVKHPKNYTPCTFRSPFQDGNHHKKHPMRRRIVFNGRRYHLISLFMGQQKCAIRSASRARLQLARLAISDADLHKDGVGPIHIHFDGSEWRIWWDARSWCT